MVSASLDNIKKKKQKKKLCVQELMTNTFDRFNEHYYIENIGFLNKHKIC